jgi:HAE1 family hydrophobic/amphiphilic exporter-1
MPVARFAVTRRVTVTMIALAIVVLGIFALPRLPVALLPLFQPPVVSVTVNYGNVAPEVMESTITRPIENAVSRVSGIDYLQSDSYQGQTVVRAQFKYGTDINVAQIDIQNQISRIANTLPNDPNLQPPQIIKQDPNSLPVVFMYITDPTRTQRDLNDLFTNFLSDEFSSISGVGSATVSGGQTRAIMVEPNQTAMAGYGLTNSDIVARIAQENVDNPAGILAIGPREFTIRSNSLFRNADEVGNTILTVKNGAQVYLHDVARVSDSIEEQRIFTRMNGTPAVKLNVTAQPDANVVAVADGAYKKIAELKKRYPTMNFTIVLDQRGFIEEAIAALEHTALLGAALAVLIILVFLHSWRATLIVSISLPVSVLGTLFVMYATHQSLNTMTLGGLALAVGLIVDDAVVVIENIFRHLDEGENALDASRNGTAQILSAVLSSTVTVITVFVPLLLIPGLQGLIFGPFGLTVMAGVAISYIVAVTTVPMLSSFTLKPSDATGGERGFGHWFNQRYGRFERSYERALNWSLDRPGLLVAVAGALLLATLAALKFGAVATEQFPPSDSRFVRFDLRLPNGTALDVTDKTAREIEKALAFDPRVIAVGDTVGSTFGGGGSRLLSNQASLSATLHEGIEGPKATAFVREWQRRLSGQTQRGAPGSAAAPAASPAPGAPPPSPVPGSVYSMIQPEQRDALRKQMTVLRPMLLNAKVFGRTIDILQQQISQGNDALQVQLYGSDYNKLFSLASGVIPQINAIPGVTRADTNVTTSQPQVFVNIDRRAANTLGLTTNDVTNEIGTATTGTIASYFQSNGVQYPIMVQAPAGQRRTIGSLETLPITPGIAPGRSAALVNSAGAGAPTSQSFGSVPLSAVATITEGLGPSQISRQNKQRRIDINAPVLGQPLGNVVDAAQAIMDRYPLPSGYRWQFGPAITQNNDTFGALALVVILAIALIYMLLASQFESFIDPLVIMVSVPLCLVGIVLSLFLTHRAFGLTAFIGSLMLVGIAVKNAILVVEFTKQLRRGGMSARDAVMHAGPRRLRPILMTTLATLGGMLPLALGIEAGSETQAPLGTVVIGGLFSSTIMSLLIVPTIYLWVAEKIEPRIAYKPPRLIPDSASGLTREPASV